jgi:hypothetical protein
MSATLPPVRGLSLLLHPGRLFAALGALVAALLYVWVAAVRAVPHVRRRKAALRRARRGGEGR